MRLRKILLVASREFKVRVREKVFILLTLLGPLVMTALFILPVKLAQETADIQIVEVFDASPNYILQHRLITNAGNSYMYHKWTKGQTKDSLLAHFNKGNADLLLLFPSNAKQNLGAIEVFSKGPVEHLTSGRLKADLIASLKDYELEENGNTPLFPYETLSFNYQSQKIENDDPQNTREAVALSMAVLIYFFIFFYGAKIMRGVMEEKNNRITEVLASSVRPMEMMAGKIMGVSWVSLLQFCSWWLLSYGLSAFLYQRFGLERFGSEQFEQTLQSLDASQYNQAIDMHHIVVGLEAVNFPLLLSVFVLCFYGGYLIYGSFYAIIGTTVDRNTDTGQFMIPVTIPLFMAVFFSQTVVNNPDGRIARVLSFNPLTAPIILPVRIPFGIPNWQIYVSMGGMLITIPIVMWLAARIYRAGILSFGEKVNFLTLIKWFKQK